MKLADVMSAANLSIYAEVGLVLFLAAFVGVAWRLFWTGRGEDWSSLGRLPLEDEQSQVEEVQS